MAALTFMNAPMKIKLSPLFGKYERTQCLTGQTISQLDVMFDFVKLLETEKLKVMFQYIYRYGKNYHLKNNRAIILDVLGSPSKIFVV